MVKGPANDTDSFEYPLYSFEVNESYVGPIGKVNLKNGTVYTIKLTWVDPLNRQGTDFFMHWLLFSRYIFIFFVSNSILRLFPIQRLHLRWLRCVGRKSWPSSSSRRYLCVTIQLLQLKYWSINEIICKIKTWFSFKDYFSVAHDGLISVEKKLGRLSDSVIHLNISASDPTAMGTSPIIETIVVIRVTEVNEPPIFDYNTTLIVGYPGRTYIDPLVPMPLFTVQVVFNSPLKYRAV